MGYIMCGAAATVWLPFERLCPGISFYNNQNSYTSLSRLQSANVRVCANFPGRFAERQKVLSHKLNKIRAFTARRNSPILSDSIKSHEACTSMMGFFFRQIPTEIWTAHAFHGWNEVAFAQLFLCLRFQFVRYLLGWHVPTSFDQSPIWWAQFLSGFFFYLIHIHSFIHTDKISFRASG